MDARSVERLEFPLILEEVASYALSEEGRRRLGEQGFFTDPRLIEEELARVGAWRTLIARGVELPPSFPDIGALQGLLKTEGARLSLEDLCAYMLWFEALMRLRASLVEADLPPLSGPAAALPDFSAEYELLSRYIAFPPEIREEQVPELRQIRQRIRAIQEEIERIAYRYLHDPAFEGVFRAAVPTQREGRTVLPVNINFRGRVRGIVHEVSSSGATAYIEPFEIVEQNNLLVQEQNRYQEVVDRLLGQLSQRVRARWAEVEYARGVLGVLDAAYAKARYGAVHRCVAPARGDRPVGRKLRHPLLGEKAVPVDFAYEEGVRVCVLSGANAGGKTVFLKTLGLAVLMHQFGMEVPAEEGTVLPVYERVLVVLGDEQSLQSELSTFSAYMKRVAEVLDQADARSLVLLDELGSGTDPEEGGALSVAVLEELRQRGAWVLVTTHQAALKAYAYATPGVMNASVNFDEESLRPLYTITPGVPGASYALAIARRMGVPEGVCRRAEEYLSGRGQEVSVLIRNLLTREQELAWREEECARREREVEARERALREREEACERWEAELRREGVRDLREFLREARRRVEEAVREVREGRREAERRAREVVARVEERVGREEAEVERVKGRRGRRVRIEPGMRVRHVRTRAEGVVVEEKRGKWVVQFPTMRVVVDGEELVPVDEGRGARGPEVVVERETVGGVPVVLDVRGIRLEEARRVVEEWLDRAVLAGMREVSVVHGTGTGVLQKGVQDLLRAHPHVERFQFAPPEQGGFGRTLVWLKQGEGG
ncbi:endonuclease MutS2 [Spirochaeta thermophila]|nr:Smr/MutS family protein [Spirochaeta thermophila]